MTFITPFAIAALVLDLMPGPVGLPRHGTGIETPILVRGGASGQVTADFSRLDYFPNLKSKLGFASNLRNVAIAEAGPYLNEIGPGLMCGHVEFDHWFKWRDDPVPALSEQYETPGDPSTRPVVTNPTPGRWLTDYQQMLGDLNIAMLFQLTGAPAQFQVERTGKAAPHPGPTDPEGAAAFVGRWVAAENHPYPVLWSLWNEPGHELAGIDRRLDVSGDAAFARESKREFDAREENQRGKAAVAIADLFVRYQSQMARTVADQTRFGLSSFIAADFNADKLTSGGNVFFKAVFDTLAAKAPTTPVDFVSFNTFNDGWRISLSGARAVLASRPDVGPMILTQYAPVSLKLNEDGSVAKGNANTLATPLAASADMLTDLAQLQRAADVQHVCMSYWVGAEYGFLSDKRTMVERVRYQVIKLFAALPILRTSLDFGGSGLAEAGLNGLAGINAGKAAVLLWNQGEQEVTVTLDMIGLPDDLAASGARLSIITETSDGVETGRYAGGELTLPEHAVALIEVAGSAADPLLRRKPIRADDGTTRFLATESFPDRVPAPCGANQQLPKVKGCAANTGTFGFYDSVRGIAYLGMGKGSKPAKVTASYETLPSVLYASVASYPAADVAVAVEFPACGKAVQGATQGGVLALDFGSIPAACRIGEDAKVTLSMAGAAAGTQAEIYLSADAGEAALLAVPSVPQPSPVLPSVDEGLVVPPFRGD